MDHSNDFWFYISILFGTLILAKMIIWVSSRYSRLKLLEKCGIPGPRPSFLYGNMTELKSETNPNCTITNWIKKYGNVFGYYMGEIPYVVVKDLDILQQVMIRDFHLFSNRLELPIDIWPLNRTIVFLRGKRWKEVRSVLTPTFSLRKIKLMTHIMKKKVDVTLNVVSNHVVKDEAFNIHELAGGLTLDIIADCVLAMKTQCQENQQDEFLVAVREFFNLGYVRVSEYALMFPPVAFIMKFFTKFIKSGKMTAIIVENVKIAIEARKKNSEVNSKDMLQLMLEDRDKGTKDFRLCLTDEEVIANAYVFILAGYETTATALAFTFYLLVKHPEAQRRLQHEIDSTDGKEDLETIQNLQYLDQVLNESLRLYPPISGFITRRCANNYQVGAYVIPKGAIVQAPVWDIHHDPNLWKDPWTFDPERFSVESKTKIKNLSFIPFGIGPRKCVGDRFAQTEVKLAIFHLLKKFTFEACEETGEKLRLTCPTISLSPENGVFVRAKLREKTDYIK